MGPEAFLEPKKKQPLSILLNGDVGAIAEKQVPGVDNEPREDNSIGEEELTPWVELDSGKEVEIETFVPKKVPKKISVEMKLVSP